MPGVFISYRRQDSGDIAGRVYDSLIATFGKDLIFKDSYNLEVGQDFRTGLRETVATCSVMLVLIGERWLSITDSQGNRRLDNPDDWVRYEVATALSRPNLPVIPVLLKNATHPPEAELPDNLRDICYRQSASLRDDPHFPDDIRALTGRLQQHIPLPAAPVKSDAGAAAATTSISISHSGRGDLIAPVNSGSGSMTVIQNKGMPSEVPLLERKIRQLEASRPKIQAQLRNAEAKAKARGLAKQSSQRQRQGLQTLVALPVIVVVSILLVAAVHPVVGVITGIVLLGALILWSSRRTPAVNRPASDELDALRSQLGLVDEMITRHNDEIERLSRLSSGG